MNTKPFSVSAALFIAVLLIYGAVAAGAGPATESPLVWVRQDPPVINVNNDPTFYESPVGDRFEGSFWEYIVDETAISYEERYVDHGYEYYHVTLSSEFDRPPLVINPPLRYKISAVASHSATKVEGAEGVGIRFWYNSDLAGIDPQETLVYYPWSPYFDGTNSKDWMIEAPPAAHPGQTFTVTFGWWNCPPCNVTWTYLAEPAYEVEQLGAEVVAPVVRYQGEEVAPGETFFPGSCAIPDGKSANCQHSIELTLEAVAYLKCMSQIEQILAIVERSQISELKKDLVMYIAGAKLMEQCRPSTREGDGYELDLVLEQGAFLLESANASQSIGVHTAVGTAIAAAPGTLLAGYHPDNKIATFKAFSVPLIIQPNSGPGLVLQPGHQVNLTAAGFGPVTELPRVLVPVAMR